MFKAFIAFMAGLLLSTGAFAQSRFGGIVSVDKTVHDWGDVTVKDGPLSCSFTVTNISNEPVMIRTVASSCGCTGVKWTIGEIAPGQSGTIEATYANDEGPYAFDKSLTVNFVGVRKPLILHLRGVVHPKKMPLKDTYTVQFGPLGLREGEVKIGNLSQGEQKSMELRVANVSKKEIKVGFDCVSPFLSFTPSELKIAGNSTAVLGVTVRADRSLWGRNLYYATPVVDGVRQEGRIAFTASTRENFDGWSEKQLASAPAAQYDGSFAADPVESGTPVRATFKIANSGKTPLTIYKIDYNSSKITPFKTVNSIKAGSKAVFEFELDTAGMKPDGDNLGIITLYTNDPHHSLIHLYIDVIIL